MAVNINLLPTELKVSKGLSQILSVLRMMGVIALAFFLILALGIGAFFVISSINLNNLTTSNNNLKSQLSSMSTTESQYYLLKDRVAKIKLAQNFPSATDNFINFLPFISGASTITLSELDVVPTKINATMGFGSNAELKNFIDSISKSTVYNVVTVSSFGFNPATGYILNLIITTK